MRVLLDTCVVIDVLQGREPFCRAGQSLFLLAANQRFTGCITAKASTDIHYIMRRYFHDDKESRATMQKLFTLFEVLDTTGMDCRRAIPSTISDYEDAVMIETAARSDVDAIITRNAKDYIQSPVTVYSPDQFIAFLESLSGDE